MRTRTNPPVIVGRAIMRMVWLVKGVAETPRGIAERDPPGAILPGRFGSQSQPFLRCVSGHLDGPTRPCRTLSIRWPRGRRQDRCEGFQPPLRADGRTTMRFMVIV